MKVQTQTFDKGNKLFIQTPLGRIEITRLRNESLKKLRIRMPNFFDVHKEGESAKNGLVREEGGKLLANFSMLVPVLTKEGELQGVAEPTTLRMKDK